MGILNSLPLRIVEEVNCTEREEIGRWLECVKQALLTEGFKDTLFQMVKPGQVFGLVKDVGDAWQYHVRGFENGHLESEFEIRRHFLEHPGTSRPATEELCRILDQHNIPYNWEGQLTAPIQVKTEPPGTLTDWRPWVAIGVALAAAIGIWYLFKR